MTAPELLAALQWRYATKKFDPAGRIPAETWSLLEDSLVLTPSSFGLQPWRFFVVHDTAKRKELVAASWGQNQVTDASHFVVLTARRDITDNEIDRWIERMAEVQGCPAETLAPYREVVAGFASRLGKEERAAWNTRQLYIALGQLMAAAAVLGIDTCPMEGIDPAAYDHVLGLENSEFGTRVACALGYRAADDKCAAFPKTRFPKDAVVIHI
ncbi:MAG: NAD(P)H-dependent oxidoreductase [Verrucomicrobiota bacterium]